MDSTKTHLRGLQSPSSSLYTGWSATECLMADSAAMEGLVREATVLTLKALVGLGKVAVNTCLNVVVKACLKAR